MFGKVDDYFEFDIWLADKYIKTMLNIDLNFKWVSWGFELYENRINADILKELERIYGVKFNQK